MARRNRSQRASRRSALRHRGQHDFHCPLRFESLEDRRLLSITVNTLADENDGIAFGGISLRDALAAAAPGDTINFAPSLTAAGPATILLTHGELAIIKSLTVSGPGASLLTIDASGSDPNPGHQSEFSFGIYDGTRVLNIDDATATEKIVSISGLKLTGADVDGDGGGILNNEQLTLTNCEVSGNFASKSGGGVANHGDALITGCTLAANAAGLQGGGASNTLNLTINDTSILNNGILGGFGINTPVNGGGGVYSAANLNIARSTISGNSSSNRVGGGVAAGGSAAVTITQSALTSNTSNLGGGVYGLSGSNFLITSCNINQNSAATSGGALFLKYASLSLINSTITGNSAALSGNALYISVDQPPVEISECTIVSNYGNNGIGGGIFLAAGNLHLSNTIVAKNSAFIGSDMTGLIGSSFDASFCLIGDGTKSGIKEAPVGLPDAKGNLVGGAIHGTIDPLLSELIDHGGPTWTFLPSSFSPAIDAGNPAAIAGLQGIPQFDERGAPFSRVASGRIDVGATERQTVPGLNLVVDTLSDDSDGNYSAGHLSLREAIGLANGSAGNDTISFAPALTSGGPATIYLVLGALTLDESAAVAGPGASVLTINGSKSNSSSQNSGSSTDAFDMTFGADNVELDGISITEFGTGLYARAAVASAYTNLTMNGCNIFNNSILGLSNYSGALHVTGSTFSNNQGGGIINNQGLATIASSNISGNTMAYQGGGIYNSHLGNMTITDTTISGNSAKYGGGGIYNAGTLDATNVTISGNSTTQNGGGIFDGSNYYQATAILTLRNSTICQNSAALGDGMFVGAGIASLNNSIIAGNYNSSFNSPVTPDLSGLLGALITPKYCLIGLNLGSGLAEAPLGSPDANGNLIGGSLHGLIDPKLGQLENNGGNTLTCALLVGSPAIGAGDPVAVAGVNNVPQFDQRGTPFGRVYGGRIDMGAIEFRPPLPGDYNSDGTVDAADYSVWRDTLGSTTDLRADSSGPIVGTPNGIVDQADYDFWKSHFGNTLAPAAGAAAVTVDQPLAVLTAEEKSSPAPQPKVARELLSLPLPTSPLRLTSSFASSSSPLGPSAHDSALLLWLAEQPSINRRANNQVRLPTHAREASDNSSDIAFDLVDSALDTQVL